MRAVEKGISEELLPVFGSKAVAAAVLTCAFGAPAFAQSSAPPAPPLLPITLEGNAERGVVHRRDLQGLPRNSRLFQREPGLSRAEARRSERRLHRGRAARLSPRHARPRHDASASVVAVGSGHRRRRRVLRDLRRRAPKSAGRRASAATIEAGRAKAATCVACHGPEGVAAAPQWPNLAGQHETYLLEALGQYKSGSRVDLVMNPLMGPLDEDSIEELAAFFASQPHLHNTAR